MAVYAIGDIQGCYPEFLRLLDKVGFTPGSDRLILLGDLVNRGPDSLSVIRFVMKHDASIDLVLGNHDIHLLAAMEGSQPLRTRDSFEDVLNAPEREEINQWLAAKPLAIHDRTLDIVAVHAGIHPNWNLSDCLNHANEAREWLAGPKKQKFLKKLYGNKPRRWSEDLRGWERGRVIVNVLTRMRYLGKTARMDFREVGPPGTQKRKLTPWFEYPDRTPIEPTILFGHWSSLGVYQDSGFLALDSGCCWGGRLSAARLDLQPFEIIQVSCKS